MLAYLGNLPFTKNIGAPTATSLSFDFIKFFPYETNPHKHGLWTYTSQNLCCIWVTCMVWQIGKCLLGKCFLKWTPGVGQNGCYHPLASTTLCATRSVLKLSSLHNILLFLLIANLLVDISAGLVQGVTDGD